jgi:nucleoside-diphosphate kinase
MIMDERTLVLIKPDGVERALIGKIIATFEDAGLRVIALKMIKATREQVEKHYAADEKWLRSVGEKSLQAKKERGEPITEDPIQAGMRIRDWLVNYLTEGPIVAMVVAGNNAIEVVRKLVGSTQPIKADPSTIRGKFASDSYDLADSQHRSVRNLVHASEDKENAEREIKVWFSENEILDYKRADSFAMFHE